MCSKSEFFKLGKWRTVLIGWQPCISLSILIVKDINQSLFSKDRSPPCLFNYPALFTLIICTCTHRFLQEEADDNFWKKGWENERKRPEQHYIIATLGRMREDTTLLFRGYTGTNEKLVKSRRHVFIYLLWSGTTTKETDLFALKHYWLQNCCTFSHEAVHSGCFVFLAFSLT